jgi:hypothetical protein
MHGTVVVYFKLFTERRKNTNDFVTMASAWNLTFFLKPKLSHYTPRRLLGVRGGKASTLFQPRH